MKKQQRKLNYLTVLLALMLVASSSYADAKRDYGRSKKPSSSGTHRQPSTSATKYSPGSHVDPISLSYSNHNTQSQRPSAPGAAPPSIGWNVPKQQGPPPSYSRSDPIGGAKTNVHEPAPAYKANNAPPPKYQTPPPSTNNYNRQGNRNFNTTSGMGGGVHSNIAATNAHTVQSSYPRQQVPAGTTYHQPGSLPAGASYYPAGSLPAGASYHPAGSLPAGASYHPAGSLPAGASYHPAGSLPAGASYYPAGSLPAGASYHPAGSLPAGASYHPAGSMPAGSAYYPQSGALPAGATYIQPGAALPAGAVYYPQAPQKTSSGLGIGGSLAAGALGGAIGGSLTHLLLPSNTRTVEHVPASNNGGDTDKIVIINNGPPGSVTTQQVGSGTTVITTGQQPAAAAAPAPEAAPAPGAPGSAPLAPMQPVPSATDNSVPLAPLAGAAAAVAAAPSTTAADSGVSANLPAAGAAPPEGAIICIPVTTEEPDPADPTKTKIVEKTACYPAPAPQPQPTPAPAPVEGAGAAAAAVAVASPMSEGMVPLAPMNPLPSTTAPPPELMKVPSEDKITTAKLSENSVIKTAASGSSTLFNTSFLVSTMMTFVAAYCMH